jgi:hypothetical protein
VERVHLPILADAGLRDDRAIVGRLRGRDYALDLSEGSRDAPVLAAVARIVARLRARESEIYREHLLHGGPNDGSSLHGTRGVQRAFADVLAETLDDRGWHLSPVSIAKLAARARRGGLARS